MQPNDSCGVVHVMVSIFLPDHQIQPHNCYAHAHNKKHMPGYVYSTKYMYRTMFPCSCFLPHPIYLSPVYACKVQIWACDHNNSFNLCFSFQCFVFSSSLLKQRVRKSSVWGFRDHLVLYLHYRVQKFRGDSTNGWR